MYTAAEQLYQTRPTHKGEKNIVPYEDNTYNKESSINTSVLASKSPPPLPSDGALLTVIGTTFFSCFTFQPSILSFQATLPDPENPGEISYLNAEIKFE
jgi:hypothetical protein